MRYLGHVIYSGHLAVSQRRIDVAFDLYPATNIAALQLFQGLCNFFKRFVPNIDRAPAPLKRNFRKDQPTHIETLIELELHSLRILQEKLTSLPFLSLKL